MKLVVCTACGSRELSEEDGYVVCVYCQSRFVPQADEVLTRETVVGLQSDVELLLQKCQDDPANRTRYAGLVLDIDPTNQAARNYLQ
jgi:hypothetical protein